MQRTNQEDELLSIAQLQRFSGESESAWRKRLGNGEIPFIKLGANVRVRRSDFEQFLNERTVPVEARG